MSVTTSTKSFRDMTRREAIDLCYILEEQRDKALGQRDALAAKVADLESELASAQNPLSDCNCGWGGQHDPDNPRCEHNIARAALTEGEKS